MSNKNAYVRFSYRWHRRIGVLICIPIIFFSITGLILNHTERLKLDQINITNDKVLSWYGMSPKTPPITIRVTINNEDYWVTALDDVLYLNDKRIQDGASMPTGVGILREEIIISTEGSVIFLERDSKSILEKLGNESLPAGKLVASVIKDGRLLIDTTQGQFTSGSDMRAFVPEVRSPLEAPRYSQLPTEIKEKIFEDWRGQGLSLWRVLIDLHSGVTFGKIGSLIVDISAILIVVLVLSGLYTWSRIIFR